MKPLRLGIIANTGKPRTAVVIPPFLDWLKGREIPFVVARELADFLSIHDTEASPMERIGRECDVVLSFGGDGTFLRTARYVAPHDAPIFGVNMGGFGYLAEVSVEQLKQCIEELLQGRYIVQERAMLVAQATGVEAGGSYAALNDIVIDKGGFARTIRLVTNVDGDYLNTFYADGLIVATPTGSTGYSLSVGGPIIEPEVGAMIINPIGPHMLANRPLVVNGARSIEITAFSEAGEFQITADGQRVLRLKSGEKVTINRAPYRTRIILFGDYSFYEVLRNKLHWRNQISESHLQDAREPGSP